MRKKLLINLAMVLVIPGFLFTVSCAKKTIRAETSLTQQAEDEAAAEKSKQEELARQQAIEEQRLQEEAERKTAARNMFLNEDIFFEFDSAVLLAEAQEILKKKAEWLINNSDVTATIEGHCDERGTNEYNLALGERRAESAKTFLMDLGIAESRLNSISYGEERPLDPGHNEEAWAKNRRGHFTIN
ncbi:MAG: peptidoglycan-associated lipoprotein Pal [Thermodesulfobacteriota bacterium]|nr:peptidoglycan-associated lipoprotein Pal [Thermodesulfobacteriota bacterium]